MDIDPSRFHMFVLISNSDMFLAAVMQQRSERVFLWCCTALRLQELYCLTRCRGSTPDKHNAAVAAALVTKAASCFCFNVVEIEPGLPHGIRNLRVRWSAPAY